MKKFLVTILFFLFISHYAQSVDDYSKYKERFFLYPTIGIDSAISSVDKIFNSSKPLDKAFAYTAKRHLLTITGNYKNDIYLEKIYYYLKQINTKSTQNSELSNIYNILGNTDKANENLDGALTNFLRAEHFAKKSSNVLLLNKIKGNIASVKGDSGLWDEAIKETREVIALLLENKNNFEKDYYKIQLYNQYNNLGNWYLQKADEKGGNIKYLDSSKTIYKTLLKYDLNALQQALVFENLGNISSLKNNYSDAIANYKQSLLKFNSAGSDKNIISTEYNLAYNYFKLQKYSEAKNYFKKVLNNEKNKSSFKYLFSNQYLAKIYIDENKKDSANYFLDTFLELYSKKTDVEKKEYANIYKKIENKTLSTQIEQIKEENDDLKSRTFTIIVIISVILLGLFIYIYHQVKEKKKARIKLELLLNEIEESKTVEANSFSKVTIKDEKEKQIINGLKKIEENKYYLNQDFNLYNAAKKIGTNTTYLTKVVKCYSNLSFSEYTNDLRMTYLINELVNDKKIRNYTVQALAELVGYKNGTSFSKIFKEKTGVTPFQFIEKLK